MEAAVQFYVFQFLMQSFAHDLSQLVILCVG